VASDESGVHDDMGAGCAQVAGVAFVFAVAAKQLDLDGHGETLIFGHGFRRLTVEHDAAIANGPPGPAG